MGEKKAKELEEEKRKKERLENERKHPDQIKEINRIMDITKRYSRELNLTGIENDKGLAYEIMKLNKNKVIWSELRQELKKEFHRISRMVHPDRFPEENLKEAATIAMQPVTQSNKKINEYI